MRPAIYNTFLVGLNSRETKVLPRDNSNEDCSNPDKKPSVSNVLSNILSPRAHQWILLFTKIQSMSPS
jgi:hypothetical protein